MTTITQDLDYLSAGVDELEDYLISEDLFWLLSGSSDLPRLTIGYLLLTMKKLDARLQTTQEIAKKEYYCSLFTTISNKWQTAREKKIRQEFQARLASWGNYLEEYYESPEKYSEEYKNQVKWRVILHLLSSQASIPSQEIHSLARHDKEMISAWIPDSYTWEPDLKEAFPEQEFWFLYGRLKKN